MTRTILLSLLALSVAACSPADIIEGRPSAFQAHQQTLTALAMPVAAPAAKVAAVEPEPVAPVVAEPEPVIVEAPKPVCQPIFRVLECVDGVEVWL